jgi:DNA polymerase III subunit beta
VTEQPVYPGTPTALASPSNLKFRVPRDGFADAVAWAVKSLPARATVPILNGVLIVGADDQLTISGFDYEVHSLARVPAEVASEGSVLVSGRLLAGIAGALPDKPVDLVVDGTRAALSCASAKFSLPTMPLEDYPQLPELPTTAGTLSAAAFAEAAAQVVIAAGRDEALPALTGVRIEISGSTMTLVATDRFRLAIKELDWAPAGPNAEAIVLVPAKTLAEAAQAGAAGADVKVLLETEAEAGTVARAGLFGVSGADRHTTSRLLDVEYPKYRALVPDVVGAVAVVSTAEMLEALKRVSLLADQKSPQVAIEFDVSLTGGMARLASSAKDLGDAEEVLDIAYDGPPLRIGFNAAYLRDGLASIHSDRIAICMNTPTRPVLLRQALPGDESEGERRGPFMVAHTGYTYVLMPIRLPGA